MAALRCDWRRSKAIKKKGQKMEKKIPRKDRPTRVSKLFMCGAFTARFKSDVGNVSIGGRSSVGLATAVITFINRPRNVKRYRRRSRSLSSPRQHPRCRCPRGFYRREASKKFYDDDNETRRRHETSISPL